MRQHVLLYVLSGGLKVKSYCLSVDRSSPVGSNSLGPYVVCFVCIMYNFVLLCLFDKMYDSETVVWYRKLLGMGMYTGMGKKLFNFDTS
jgi:hypothetical protein